MRLTRRTIASRGAGDVYAGAVSLPPPPQQAISNCLTISFQQVAKNKGYCVATSRTSCPARCSAWQCWSFTGREARDPRVSPMQMEPTPTFCTFLSEPNLKSSHKPLIYIDAVFASFHRHVLFHCAAPPGRWPRPALVPNPRAGSSPATSYTGMNPISSFAVSQQT